MTAKLIRQYLPTLKKWEHKQFVTLSIQNVGAEELASSIKELKAGFDAIRKKFDNDYRRKKRKNPLVGIRKIEVTYNATERTYHPHLHLIIRDPEVAHELRVQWLYHFSGRSSWDAQRVQPADDKSVLELFKYFTKLISSHSKDRVILVDTLDVIFRAVAGQRTYQAYNVKSIKVTTSDEEAKELAAQMEPEENYPWQQSVHDWVNEETGELLTGYEPHPGLRSMVEGMTTSNPPPPPNGS
jgi:hypothetical protein